MIRFIIPAIIFYLLICLFLKGKRQNAFLFTIAFSLLNFFTIQYPYITISGDKYSISLVVSFVSGMFFNAKELFIIAVVSFFALLVENNFLINVYVIPDMFAIIFSLGFGQYIGKILYKRNKINPIASVIYVTVISSIYSISFLLYLSITRTENTMLRLDLNYYLYMISMTIVLFFAFVIIHHFGDKNVEEKNSLLHIFIRRFRILLIILFFAILFVNNRFFNLYVTNKSFNLINANFEMAIDSVNKLEKKFGKNCLKNNDEAVSYISEWYSEVGGAVYFLDENFNLLNNFSELLKEKNRIQNITAEGFRDLINYDENRIVKYVNNGLELYLKYARYGNYYIVIFVSTEEMKNNLSVISYLTAYAIIVTMLAIFLLVYHVMKKNVASRIQSANSNLAQISKGDYDIVFNDNSSKEMIELSSHINATVKALKNTIKEVKEKNKRELELAKQIQESQLRTDDIAHIAFDISAKNIPAEEVGGDFYDYFYIDYRHVMFLIADVSGKGIPGAMFMINAKNAIINFAKQKLPLEEIVKRTNEFLCQNNDAMMFVTSFLGILDLRTGVLKYINCGHNEPLICVRKNDGYDVSYLNSTHQTILGIDAEVKYKTEDIALKEGDKITLYTDGITESKNEKKEFYGEERLSELYKNNSCLKPKEINNKIIESVKEFSKESTQFDDITILTLLYNNTKNEIKLDATENDINIGKEFLNKFVKLYDMPIDTERNLKIVYDEIYSNIKNYAYNNNGGELIFKVNLFEKSTIEMVFMDKGQEFNPIDYKSEKTEKNVEEKFDGGMGLMFCKNIMDDIIYSRENGYNVLRLYKKMSG